MAALDDDPVAWFAELFKGLVLLHALQIAVGLWTAALTRLPQPWNRAKLPLGLCGALLAPVISYNFVWDTSTHVIGAVIASVSLGFTTFLHSIGYLMDSTHGVPVPSPFELVLRVAVPAAVPSKRNPPERPLVQLVRGVTYMAVCLLLKPLFTAAMDSGGLALDALFVVYVTCGTGGALNFLSAFLGLLFGIQSASPFGNPLTSLSLGSFWAGRWNAPVSHALRHGVYVPMTQYYGCSRGLAAIMCFVVSGLAHEALLLNCGAWDHSGRMGLFFVVQGCLTVIERQYEQSLSRLPALGRWFLSLSVFMVMLRSLFLPVCIDSGLASKGVKSLAAGPLLVSALFEKG